MGSTGSLDANTATPDQHSRLGLTAFERRLTLSFGILSLGTGMSVSVLAVYFVRLLGVSASTLGLIMSTAALCGMVGGPIAGRIADRHDARRTYGALMVTMSIATGLLAIASAFAAAVLMCVLMASGRGSGAVMGGLVGREVAPDRRVRYRAVVKTVSNTAMIVGLGIGGLVLTVESRLLFQTSFLLEAVTLLFAGALMSTTPRQANAPINGESADEVDVTNAHPSTPDRWAMLRHHRFLALVIVNAVVMLYSSVFSIAFPVWISAHAPSLLPLVAVLSMVNVAVVVLTQIPATRWIRDTRSAIQIGQVGIIGIGIGLALFGLAGVVGSPNGVAATLIALAVLVAFGEVLYSAASWELLYAISPEQSISEYQGVFNLGLDVSMFVAPMLFAWLAGEGQGLGWLFLAGAFGVSALALGRMMPTRRT